MTPDIWFDPSKCFIAGAWVAPANGQYLDLSNPSDNSTLASIARGDATDIDAAVASARTALNGAWGRATAVERGRILTRIGQKVLEKTEELARLEAMDVGKPLKQARADVLALARYCEFYGGAADKLHGQTIPYLEGYTVYTLREPHGVTGHIVPWNYPMQIIGRSVGAALATGNACVLKPAEEACLTALAFADIARDAGRVILGHYRDSSLAVDHKADDSPVTVADRAAETLLRQRITAAFPDDAIVGRWRDGRGPLRDAESGRLRRCNLV